VRLDSFIDRIADVRIQGVFNPYSQICSQYDSHQSPQIRRANLRAYMREAERKRLDSIWFGRDLGHRGGRRTGLALTDEVHLSMLTDVLGCGILRKATIGECVGERTASEIWRAIVQLPQLPFLWNVFPFHPHEPGEPLTNRCHTELERRKCEFAMLEMLEWLQPKKVIALGSDAYRVLSSIVVGCVLVRHPSYGGQSKFRSGIQDAYGLRKNEVSSGHFKPILHL
jgi:hypothetical protein